MIVTKLSSRVVAAALVALTLVLSHACSDDGPLAPEAVTFTGAQVSIGAGMAWSEMVFAGNDLQEVSMVFTPAALNNLPAAPVTEFVLPAPTDGPASLVTHIGVNWWSGGHAPAMVFTQPHFDVHFYLASVAQRDAMTPADPAFGTKGLSVPAGAAIPPGYTADTIAIPRMGNHWTNKSGPEFQGTLFTRTFIYGFYDQKMVFLEPMITRAHLLANPDETVSIPVPQQYPAPGQYPASYRVRFDAASGLYRIGLTDFVTRN